MNYLRRLKQVAECNEEAVTDEGHLSLFTTDQASPISSSAFPRLENKIYHEMQQNQTLKAEILAL